MIKRLNKKAKALDYMSAVAFINAIIVFNVFNATNNFLKVLYYEK